VTWEPGPPVFSKPPAWITDVVPNHRGYFWAPDVARVGDRYVLYYSVSAFGKNTSAIALASNPTLDPSDPAYKWTDHGIVVRSQTKDDFNAIDPNIFLDTASCQRLDLELALAAYGAEQIVLGTDVPVIDPAPLLRTLEGLGPFVGRAVAEQNPERVLNHRGGAP